MYALLETKNIRNQKKTLDLLILAILEKYSDAEHHLSQKQIVDILANEYDTECDRRSVKNNIDALRELGFEIWPGPDDEAKKNDGYFLSSRDFEDADLRILIDAVLSSKSISGIKAKEIIEKLKRLGNKYFQPKVSHFVSTPLFVRTDNKVVIYNIDSINDAIDQKKKIVFTYNKYGIDKKLHKKGKRVFNPYQLVASNGFYYAIGNFDKWDDLAYCRVDKMTDVEILDERVKPMKQVKGLEKGLDLPKHMAEHIYMLSGEAVNVKFKCKKDVLDSVIDWFGHDIRITEDTDDDAGIIVRVKCNKDAMCYWALQYGPYVEVVEPASMRAELAEITKKMAERYNKNINIF